MINLQAINPRISANFPVKLAGTNPKVGGGHRGLPLSEGGGRIQPREGCLAGQPREPRAPWHPLWGGEMQPRGGPWPPSGREINGYPFTTFTDFSDFLGIIPRVYVRILVRLAPILPILTSQYSRPVFTDCTSSIAVLDFVETSPSGGIASSDA